MATLVFWRTSILFTIIKPAILLMKLWGSTAWDWVVSSVHGKHVSDGVWEAHWGLTWVGLATPLLVVLKLNLFRTSDSDCLKNWLSLVLYKCFVVSQTLSCVWLFAIPWTCSPPSSSVHEILQARTLEWVAIFSSWGSSRPRGQTHVSYIPCIGKWVLTCPLCARLI